MGWDSEKCIDFYYGEYKKSGIFGKKCIVKILVYSSKIEGEGFNLYEDELSPNTCHFDISYDDVYKVYLGEIDNSQAIFIDYKSKSVVKNKKATMVLLGIQNLSKCLDIIEDTQNTYFNKKKREQQIALDAREQQRQHEIEIEQQALKFYQDCYSFHIKESTPIYQIFSEKNKVALIYIDDSKALNFLKIDGYAGEENNGLIKYENIHYYEKAGSVSYTTDIHGKYSSYGGSITGGNFSKLAAVGGGLLFGFMGMALGAALTYKPSEQKAPDTMFSIGSDVKKIDDRSIILNFYSDIKKQYIDIELPQDIYNFLQTYLPEKKYDIVDELEKQTIINQSTDLIENANLLKVAAKPENQKIGVNESQIDTMDQFKQKIEKLKIMKDAGLLSDDKFEEECKKILETI